MKDEELILKAVEYCNDIPARVKDFLREEKPTPWAEPKPEFRVGDWVNWNGCHRAIGRIVKHCNSYKDSWSLEVNGDLTSHNSCNEDNLSLATPQEIESHLRKICDEKYVGKKVKCLMEDEVFTITVFDQYTHFDSMFYKDQNGYAVKVYGQGEWAEIIPDKKKLPKTKDEFVELVADIYRKTFHTGDFSSVKYAINDFIKDYED